nr:8591_t:CDS:2 [Entrophospora candida]CAG8450496.1 10521_t:CDS:2 [Entrophospora candida]
MSWKGTTKAIGRLPQQIKQKTKLRSSTKDYEYNDASKKFAEVANHTEKLHTDVVKFRDQVSLMLNHQANLSNLLVEVYNPIQGLEPTDGAVVRRQKTSSHSIKVVESYSQNAKDLRDTILSDLDLLDHEVIHPIADFLTVIKLIKKTITKRDHKKVDYERYSANVKKYKDMKDKILSASEEKNLYKQEDLLSTATQEYEYYNNLLKKELPLFFDYMIEFIEPVFESFYRIQIRIFRHSIKRLEKVVDKSDIDIDSSIVDSYDERVEDAKNQIQSLTLLNREAKLAKSNPENAYSATPSVSARKASFNSMNSSSNSKLFPVNKKIPSPIPPPIPAKPKIAYVKALYDYDAQADGDLSFHKGDKIEVLKRTPNTDDWWEGKLNGVTGIFPGNYVEEL